MSDVRVASAMTTSKLLQTALGLFAVCATAMCRAPTSSPAFVQVAEARGLAADLRVQFAKAADASDRAVMADTDEASIAFAHDAEQALDTVQSKAEQLAPRLQSLGYREETRLLEEFENHFASHRALDRDVLELAVENTNLKAQRLSFGAEQEAADSFRSALDAVLESARAKDRYRVEAVIDRALLGVREIQVLQAPHIAEPDRAVMDRLEERMATLEASARDALATLNTLVEPTNEHLAAASAAFERFRALAQQVVVLSRQNSNVRSLALALRDQPPLTAACDASLAALQDALAKETVTATR